MTLAPVWLAAAYAAAHLAFLPPALEDIDSINFALGLRSFDVAEHQPHPPGYPVYIAAGRLSLAVISGVRPAMDRVAAEALALSFWSAAAGALAILCAWSLFGRLAAGAGDPRTQRHVQRWATVLLAVCPLFWLTGLRPMSDMPGLAVALAAQALLLAGRIDAGAFVAGLALGVRSQTLWLTAPLLVFELARRLEARGWRASAATVLLAAAGALAWAVPLLVAAGGLQPYLAALGTQAGEDFAFVDMLWANPTPRRLAFGLLHTFVLPWASVPLAVLVMALAVAGAALLLGRDRRGLLHVTLAFAPYAAFHLVFQETVTVRYALPLVAPMAFLAARALAAAGPAANALAVPIAAVSLFVAVPAGVAYGREPHPAFRAVADAMRRAAVDAPVLVTSHYELRRTLRAVEPSTLPVTFAPRGREWLTLVDYWSGGGSGTVWFLANPRRTDLDLIDPRSRSDVVRYRWQVGERPELSGTRPSNVDWYRLRPPAWFVGEGWSLTPEAGGVTMRDGTGPDRAAIRGYVRRFAGPMHLLVGGRYLAESDEGAAAFELALDGAVVDRWTLTHDETNFLRVHELPGGIPDGDTLYALLAIRAAPAAGQPRTPPVAVRQFDIQPVSRPIAGFGAGWHEEEYEAATGLRWRWTSDRARLRVHAPPGAIRLRLRGESPLKYFETPSTLTLSAGGRTIDRLTPAGDWSWDVVVPAEAMAAAGGELALETNQVFVPAELMDSPDTRRLGLRVFDAKVESSR